MKPQSISQYLDGASSPSYAVLIEIADFFHVSTDYLVGRSDVSTDDMNVSAIGSKLGISEKSVSTIMGYSKLIDRIFSHKAAGRLLNALVSYHDNTIIDERKSDVVKTLNSIFAGNSIREAESIIREICRAAENDTPFITFDNEAIIDNPPPLQNDQFEIVINQYEDTPSADALERMIVEKLLRSINDRSGADGKA